MSDEVEVAVIPDCDLCVHVNQPTGKVEKAAYDGKTVNGPWAYMCEIHFEVYGVGLGTGRGQRLILRKPD